MVGHPLSSLDKEIYSSYRMYTYYETFCINLNNLCRSILYNLPEYSYYTVPILWIKPRQWSVSTHRYISILAKLYDFVVA